MDLFDAAEHEPAAVEPCAVSKRKRSRKTKAAALDPVTDYATRVVKREIIAGPHVRAACKRHLRDLEQGPDRGLRFDAELAGYYIDFFEQYLRLNGGEFEGIPFVLGPWQRFLVGSLFGWVIAETGMRRYRTAYVEIGKGNGKSPLAAGIGLAGLTIDQEPRAEIYAAATKRDQAMILFRDAVAMVDQSPALAARIIKSGTRENTWNLAFPALHSFFRVIASDDGQSGPRPHIALVDELHEHKSPEVLTLLRDGQKGRRQPLVFVITNSGTNRNSVCYHYREAAIAALTARPGDAGFDDSLFGYVCALDKGDDWMRDEACWIKANPNLGVSIQLDYLRRAVVEARNMPSRRNQIARLNFCIWTDADEAWIGADGWLKSERPDMDLGRFAGRDVYLGIDLSKRRDLTACAYFVPDDDGGGDAFVDFWTPAATMDERGETDKVPYRAWADAGHLHALAGESIEYGHVVADINRRVQALDLCVKAAAFDRWRIAEFKADLREFNVELPLVEFGQGFKSMSPALEKLETLITNGKLRVHVNPVLRWNAASVAAEEDAAGNRKFSKLKTTGRIDGMVALVMAVGVAVLADNPGTGVGMEIW